MRILHWNCQGLGNPLTVQLKDIKRKSNPEIIFLVETKNGVDSVKVVGNQLGYKNIFVVPADGLKGGLAVFWRDDSRLSVVNASQFQMEIIVTESSPFAISYIYGNPNRSQRKQMWIQLSSLFQEKRVALNPHLILGDLNEIRGADEKYGGSPRSESSFYLFREFCKLCGFYDIRTERGRYTWRGRRHHHDVQTRIDRAISTIAWFDLFPKAQDMKANGRIMKKSLLLYKKISINRLVATLLQFFRKWSINQQGIYLDGHIFDGIQSKVSQEK